MTEFRNIEEQISAYLDNQMSEADREAFEAEMVGNPELVARIERWSATDQLFASSIPTPSDAHLDALLAASSAANTSRWPGLRIAAMLAVFAFGGVGGYGLSQFTTNPQTTIIVQATMGATNSHRVFAAEKRHAVEVTADETEHLQTWLADRMGREMTVPNLSAFGLTFLGGRMLPFDDRAAAQYMYETADGKRVTLFMTRLDKHKNTDVQILEEANLTSLRWQIGEWVFILTAPLEQQQMLPLHGEIKETLL